MVLHPARCLPNVAEGLLKQKGTVSDTKRLHGLFEAQWEYTMKELRANAEKKLGDQFDIRLFHDEILRHGAVPLDILETQVKTWLIRQAAK